MAGNPGENSGTKSLELKTKLWLGLLFYNQSFLVFPETTYIGRYLLDCGWWLEEELLGASRGNRSSSTGCQGGDI